LEQALQASRPTINRALRDLLAIGFLEKLGGGRSTRYVATDVAKAALSALPSAAAKPVGHGLLQWSSATLALIEALRAPLGTLTGESMRKKTTTRASAAAIHPVGA
jgi:hypothetical protein